MTESPVSPPAAAIDRPVLAVIVVPAQPELAGLPVGTWFEGHAGAHGGFEVRLVDLAEFAVTDNGSNPDAGQPSALGPLIDAADGIVFVLPAYEPSTPEAFTALLDRFTDEWRFKPAAFVSYGELSSGIRQVLGAKPALAKLQMTPTTEAVTIPFVSRSIVDGRFTSTTRLDDIATSMLDELGRWTRALKPYRTVAPSPE